MRLTSNSVASRTSHVQRLLPVVFFFFFLVVVAAPSSTVLPVNSNYGTDVTSLRPSYWPVLGFFDQSHLCVYNKIDPIEYDYSALSMFFETTSSSTFYYYYQVEEMNCRFFFWWPGWSTWRVDQSQRKGNTIDTVDPTLFTVYQLQESLIGCVCVYSLAVWILSEDGGDETHIHDLTNKRASRPHVTILFAEAKEIQ